MAFRPTIALVIRGEFADMVCLRNREGLEILHEAARLVVLYGDCPDPESYRIRRYGARQIAFALDPEILEPCPETWDMLTEASEFPVIADCDTRCIYVSRRILTPEEQEKLPLLGSPERPLCSVSIRTDFLALMESCRIPFSLFALRPKAPDGAKRGRPRSCAVVDYVVC